MGREIFPHIWRQVTDIVSSVKDCGDTKPREAFKVPGATAVILIKTECVLADELGLLLMTVLRIHVNLTRDTIRGCTSHAVKLIN